MGFGPFSKRCFTNRKIITAPNPNPSRFKILMHEQVGNILVVKVKYLDCINYEGVKIMVFKDINIHNLKNWRKLDPHFNDKVPILSPIARFVPTDEGWNMALKFAASI